ncbi:putative hydroxymethylpyrimidine transport system ATP-binding protein [Clostridium tetanomorphum]|uniref:ABC-type quaternary amine transporter n=1 Tax=Clostridium tetanomorphum TaxID=1553 RepID=A0A923J1K5_CLOTT|nr:ABC transporter ATP-binding protein [Clostridium tetanomorphum]KAJ49676.1 ABC transporter ATP-binding protein [Clostridium tetanomorphum DSM 665]KAJ49899.1 ABC transporter ATP-binding protein [Clostridium tetanomorphum DSM 665]MBC2397825.1 ABC transporter ATP-binding protein [Clostridium tetanomorphum]MBP1864572.1 putative hydroxymethylpyrimidine transport system ATP-binding protein [Clostridium tetanomorphum]NRS84041.1 putative hydroxymethylpyrimidine transport system ATP-binding protein [
MLRFCDVNFKYSNEKEYIIENLSFHVNGGEFISIIGPSGCGKSTIFRLITGLEKVESGNIFVNDKNINNLRGYIGYMPQRDLLIPWRTILENACLPLEIQGENLKEAKKEAEKFLTSFGLGEYKDKYPKDLSGGMRQRVSFIRTLLTGSDIMLLDEPFSALDAITKISMQEWILEQWANLKKTILFITHDVEEALFLSSRIFVVSEKPITKLKEVIVPVIYPRNRHMLSEPEILNIKEELVNELKQRVQL